MDNKDLVKALGAIAVIGNPGFWIQMAVYRAFMEEEQDSKPDDK